MKLYAIVTANGEIRRSTLRRHRSFHVFDTFAKAKNNARADGDSVVEVDVDLTREPLFIRKRVQKTTEG